MAKLTDALLNSAPPKSDMRHSADYLYRQMKTKNDALRELLRVIVASCTFHASFVPNPTMPIGLVDPRLDKYRDLPRHQFKSVGKVTDTLRNRVQALLFTMDADTRRAIYSKLRNSGYSFALSTIDAIMTSSENITQEELRESFKIRFVIGLSSRTTYVIEPLMEEWELERLNKIIFIRRCPEQYKPDTLRKVAERAMRHRFTEDNLKNLDTFLLQLGCPRGAMEEIWLMLQDMQAYKSSISSSSPIQQQAAAAPAATPSRHVSAEQESPATPASVPGNEAQEKVMPDRTLSPAMLATLDRAGKILACSCDLPYDLQQSLIELETIIAECGPSIFKSVHRTNGRSLLQSSVLDDLDTDMEMAGRRAAILLHGELQRLRIFQENSPPADDDTDQLLIDSLRQYLRHLATIHTHILSAFRHFTEQDAHLSAPVERCMNTVCTEAVAGLFVTEIASRISPQELNMSWKPSPKRSHEEKQKRIQNIERALQRVLPDRKEVSDPERHVLHRLIESGLAVLPLLAHGNDDKGSKGKEQSSGYVQIPEQMPDTTYTTLCSRDSFPKSKVELRYRPTETNRVQIIVESQDRPSLHLAYENIGSRPCLPNSIVPLEEILGRSGSDITRAMAYGQETKKMMLALLRAVDGTPIASLLQSMRLRAIPLRLFAVDRPGNSTNLLFLLSAKHAEELGLACEPMPSDIESVLATAGVTDLDSMVFLRGHSAQKRKIEEVELTERSAEKIIRDFLIKVNVNILPLPTALAFLALAGIRLEKGKTHCRAIDEEGRVRAVGNMVISKKEMPVKFIVETLFHTQQSFPPIGDTLALADWIRQEGTYEKLKKMRVQSLVY